MSARRIGAAFTAVVVTGGVVVGLVSGAFGSLAEDGLYATGLWSPNGASTRPSPGPSGSPTPTPSSARATPSPSAAPPPPGLPAPVLAAVVRGAEPDQAEVQARVGSVKVPGIGSASYTAAVVDVGSGQTVYAHNPMKSFIPASTVKLLTSAAALSILGPDHTFATRVVSPQPGQIILVGGGDPYLSEQSRADTFPRRASVADLARSSAAALKKANVRSVTLGYDDSLFTGPRWHPTWPGLYADQVTPVSALWVDEGRVRSSPGPRVEDPSLEAAQAYAAALRRQGIKVGAITRQKAAPSARPVASVSSMPLEQIVEQLLLVSDNDASEVIYRQAAIGAGKLGSFVDAGAVVRDRLTELGVWKPGTTINDGSGLSRQSRVPAATLAQLLDQAASDTRPELRAVITGLPVAGGEGSLRTHFGDAESRAGRGVVRGKTGTLNKVHSLAGLIRTEDGSVLAYAFLVNDPENDFNAKVWLDRVSAALSTCGCR